MIAIRAWDYHAGLRDQGEIVDYDFYSARIPPEDQSRIPRAAFVTGTRARYEEALARGLTGHFPRRDDRARSERDTSYRARIRMYIANPRTYNPDHAGCPRRHEGMILIDLRATLARLEVRVAGTPSPYPNLFAFPSDIDPREKHPMLIPPEDILGFHAFNVSTLESVTDTGINYEGIGPELWLDRNIGLLPSIWPEFDRRVLKLPPQETSSDRTLEAHQRDLLTRILFHGMDDSRADPTSTRDFELSASATEPSPFSDFYAAGPKAKGKGKRGGGNAPRTWVPRYGPASTRPSDFQQEGEQYPRDRFGCFIIPPDFSHRGFSFEEWTRFGLVPEERIMAAVAYNAGVQDALRNLEAASANLPPATAPTSTWECSQCRGILPETDLFCGRCGQSRYGPRARLASGGGNAPGPAAAAVVTQGVASVGGQHPAATGPVPDAGGPAVPAP